MSRKAMKQALDTLERRHAEQSYPQPEYLCAAIAALRATLAKAPEPHCTYPACEPATVGGCDGPCGQALSGAKLAEAPEPVAWMTPGQDLHLHNPEGFRFSDWTPLYTAPPARVPLTDDECDKLRQDNGGQLNFVTLREFRVIARAVERAHGITGEQE
jgi:hypothetical protein